MARHRGAACAAFSSPARSPFSEHAPLRFSGVTTNPDLIRQAMSDRTDDMTPAPSPATSGLAEQAYHRAIRAAAQPLLDLWTQTGGQRGWVSAQIRPSDYVSVETLVHAGRALSRLAPNVMVKVPGCEVGYQEVETLVAEGISINPVRVSRHGVELDLGSTTVDEALAVNLAGQRCDGIDRIDDDGTVYFTAEEMEVMSETIGYSHTCMKLDGVAAHAEELTQKFADHRAAVSQTGAHR